MLESFFSDEQRLLPDRARELFTNLVYPESIIDVGVVDGPRLRWFPVKVLRTTEELKNALILYAPERGEQELMLRPDAMIAVFRYHSFEGISFVHRVNSRGKERQAAGSMIDVVGLSIYSAAYEFDRRRHARVSPRAAIEVGVHWHGGEDGELSNTVTAGMRMVSMSGAGVTIPHISVDAGMHLRPGAELEIELRLSSDRGDWVVIPAELVQATRDPQKPGQMRLGLEWADPSQATIRELAAFITIENKAALRAGLETLRTLDPRSRRAKPAPGASDDGDRIV